MPDVDTLLAQLNDDVPEMTDEAFTNGRARLHAAMSARRTGRRLTVLVAAATAVLAVGSAVLLPRTDAPATVTTSADLTDWARNLADLPPRVGPGQYLYERIHSTTQWNLADPRFRVQVVSTGDQWIPYDYRDEWQVKFGGDRLEFVRGTEFQARTEGVTIPSTAPAADMTAKCGRFAPEEPCDGEGWGITGSPAFYAGLTGDPAKLYRAIATRAREAGDDSSLGLFTQADLLLQPNIPNDFRATLFEAMSRIPGLEIDDNATTRDGRVGIRLRMAANGSVREQIVDRTTGDLIQGRLKDPDSEAVSTVTYGVADDRGELPD